MSNSAVVQLAVEPSVLSLAPSSPSPTPRRKPWTNLRRISVVSPARNPHYSRVSCCGSRRDPLVARPTKLVGRPNTAAKCAAASNTTVLGGSRAVAGCGHPSMASTEVQGVNSMRIGSGATARWACARAKRARRRRRQMTPVELTAPCMGRWTLISGWSQAHSPIDCSHDQSSRSGPSR